MARYLSEFRLYVCNQWISRIPSHRIRLWYYRRVMKFTIGPGSYILMGCSFDCAGGLSMGRGSVINPNCRIDTRGSVTIGNNVSISNEVIILTADHDMNSPTMAGREKAVTLEDYVWIGTRAMILPGVTLRQAAVAAAGSVVTKSTTPYSVVAGIPAQEIKKRSSEQAYTYDASYKRLFQ